MPTQEERDYYFKLAVSDASKRPRRYPLWSVLVAADEHIAASAYWQGWQSVTKQNLRMFRDSGQRR